MNHRVFHDEYWIVINSWSKAFCCSSSH